MTEDQENTCFHEPVLLGKVLAATAPRGGQALLDGTFGAGGYSRALLQAAHCRVFAIDRDPLAVSLGHSFEERYEGRFQMIEGRYSQMEALLADRGINHLDGIVLDIGVSSMQIDNPERGFSFQNDGPLDMRMGNQGQTAADVVNTLDSDELARIFRELGEERHAKRIARAIVDARADAPITRTLQLAGIVSRITGKGGASRIHPATRVFQALRIHVNDELGELQQGLEAAERVLAPGGRLVVVSFHSLEDRIVKRFLRQRGGGDPGVSRHLPEPEDKGPVPSFTVSHRRAILAEDAETEKNPRARSARLRSGVRTSAPAWPARPNQGKA